VTAAGAAYCWGLNGEGQVGDGSRLDRLAPRPIATTVSALAAGSSHTCAVVAGRALCWGDNRSGQLGDGTTEARVRPTAVIDLPGTPTALVAGAVHTCALLTDGTAACWGQNLYGQLGNGSTANATTPIPVSGDLAFERLSAGGAVTCGRTSDGDEYCWGLNQSGQLGDGTVTNRAVPTRVGG
jgi:alpha-tubulin suppressor-like RCC1 family protein